MLDALGTYLDTLPGLAAALLFGSAARERLRPESDIDLALLFGEEAVPEGFALLDLRGDLEQCVGRDVDLLVLNTASPIIAHQALKTGLLLRCPDRPAYLRYVVRLISTYADLKRVRRPIEEALITGGRRARP
jgi:predicted nucleotidyltransferase